MAFPHACLVVGVIVGTHMSAPPARATLRAWSGSGLALSVAERRAATPPSERELRVARPHPVLMDLVLRWVDGASRIRAFARPATQTEALATAGAVPTPAGSNVHPMPVPAGVATSAAIGLAGLGASWMWLQEAALRVETRLDPGGAGLKLISSF